MCLATLGHSVSVGSSEPQALLVNLRPGSCPALHTAAAWLQHTTVAASCCRVPSCYTSAPGWVRCSVAAATIYDVSCSRGKGVEASCQPMTTRPHITNT